MKCEKRECYHPCLAQGDKAISEVKLTVKFNSLWTSFGMNAMVDVRTRMDR